MTRRQSSKNSKRQTGQHAQARRSSRPADAGSFRPLIELLEDRLAPAVLHWSGAADNVWSNTGNWLESAAPQAGDALVFPAAATRLVSVNDLSANLTFDSIAVQGAGYKLLGSAATLTNGLSATYASGTSVDNIDTSLTSGGVSIVTGGELDLGGALTGTAGLTLSGGGTLGLTGSTQNSYGGTTVVNDGTLLLSKAGGSLAVPGNLVAGDGTHTDVVRLTAANEIAAGAAVTVNSAGTLDLNGNAQTVGSVTGAGTVTDGSAAATFTVNDAAADSFGGTLTGSLSLAKTGAGTLTLGGTNAYTGSTAVSGGTLLVNGSVAGSGVLVTGGATLGGAGTVGAVTVTGSTVSPSQGGPGVLTTGGLTLDGGSTFSDQLNGNTAGSGGYGQLVVSSGTVNLNAAALGATLGAGYTPAGLDRLTILKNNGGAAVSGTFAGLAEGALVSFGAGKHFHITYTGGTSGRDVVLVYVQDTTTSVTNAVNPSSVYGDSVTLHAAVSVGLGTPTGTVQFYDGASALGSPVTLSGGTADLTTALLSAASHNITVQYGGDLGDAASTSGAFVQTVSPATLTVTANNLARQYGGVNPTLTDAMTGFKNGENGSVVSGSASLTTTATSASPVGTYTITAAQGTLSAANYTFTFVNGVLTVNQRQLTATVTAADKVYDGTTTATLSGSSLANVVGGDQVSLTGGTATFADKNVGTGKTVTDSGLSLTGADAGNYTLISTTATTTANITARSLTVTATGVNRVYDGTSGATVTLSDNRVAGDSLTDAYTSASFPDKNVGTAKAVGVSGLSISGADAANYTLTSTTASTTANITARSLTVTAAGVNKVYDGTATATVTLSDNRVSGDTLTDAYTSAAFPDKNVGAARAVGVSGLSISGADAANYTLSATTASTTADITARALTVTAAGVNRVYDGTTGATVSLSDNHVAGDSVTDAYTSASFADKNVGTGKAVSVSGLSISGGDAANYTLTATTAGTTADITARGLTVTAAGVNKVYDGTATATATLSDNRVSGDAFTTSYTASFPDKNVGTGRAVSVSGLAISGGDSANYTLTSTTASTTANITARSLTVTATGVNRVYDGTSGATVTLSDNRVSGDTVTDAYTSAAFADKNVGTGKAVSVSGLSISGADATNYTLTATTASTTADITARALSVTAVSDSKTYDGTTASAGTPTLTAGSLVGGDTASWSQAFDSKNVGSGKALTPAGSVSDGNGGHNYSVSFVTDTTGAITARGLTVTAAGVNKVYDGTAAATVTLSDNRVSGDTFTSSYTAAFPDKNVGTGRAVSVSGLAISGGDSANYTLTATTASTTADITARALTVTATGINRVYDGTAAATVTLSDNRVAGDTITDAYTSASFADKSAGAAKAVSVSGISISGADAANYTLTSTTASTTADITARSLTVTATGVNKVYDGTATATVTLSDNRVSGDAFTTSYTASFPDKNVGTGRAVSVSSLALSGGDSANYTLTATTAGTTANITARGLTVTAAGVNKVYDGTATATATLSDNRVSGDAFTTSYAASFPDKNVGTGRAVSVSGLTLSGGDSANYTLTSTTASTTADITARALTVTATGVSKVYDGAATATVTLSDNHLAGDSFTTSYTAAFANKNVGTGKAVSVSGLSISGGDAANYTLTSTTASTTADITARALTVTAAGVNKVYDGTAAATVTLSDNRVSGDTFTTSYTASFPDKNVGTGRAVSVSGLALSGGDSANYTLTSTTASTTADITARALTATAAGVNKVYDGTATATVTLSDNRVSGDTFTTSYTASFPDKNVGTGRAVSVSGLALSGGDSANYTLTSTTASTTADITARALTVTASGVNKVYDGTATATATLSDNRVSGDTFTTSYTAVFPDKNVGTGRAVSVTGLALSGSDSANYTLTATTASTTANITARSLTVTAVGVNRVYDGTTTATVTLSDNRISGDTLTDAYTSAAFADKNVGAAKAVSVSGLSISGADSANYTLTATTASTTADITARALTVTATGVNKVYDGTAGATVTLSDNRVSGDTLTDAYTSASFADKNVGAAKAVSVSGITISGADAANYTLTATTASTTANITARALTVTATGVNRVYDGTAAATVTLSDNRVSGDTLTDAYTSASFTDKNVGAAKAVSVSGLSISGADAANYTLTATTVSTTADITARSLTVTAAGVNRVYDGTTTATVTLSDNRVSGDTLTDAYTSAAFADKNVGTGKAVSVSGLAISGGDSANYTLTATTASTTADITARALTVTAAGVSKIYDGTAAATVTLSDNRVAGDTLTDTSTSAAFANKNAGASKTVTVNGLAISGADAANYTLLDASTTATADVAPRPLTVTAMSDSKTYDGTTASAGTPTLTAGSLVGGDTASWSQAFDSKNVGSGKALTPAGSVSDGNGGHNYSVSFVTDTTGAITARSLTATAAGVNKVYDGTATATATLSDNRVSGDAFTTSYTAAFPDKNVGTGKAVSVSGLSISGGDSANYTLTATTASTNADITARALTVTATGVNKVYDGTATATATLSDNRVSGDSITDAYTSASFANKNVGTGKAVSVSGLSISGADAANYTLAATTASTTADVTARSLTVTATGINRAYNATTGATVTLSDNRVLGDSVTDAYSSASFANKNVGAAKAVSVSGLSLSGADALNYTLSSATASTTADITARGLTVSATGMNKVYDGTTAATVTLSDDRVSGDTVSDAYTGASFADKSAGVGKTVTVNGIAISGADAANYTLVSTTASTTADITARGLTVTAAGVNKVYDGTAAATVTLSDNHLAGDSVTDAYTSASFADKNAGTGKAVSVSGLSLSGADAANYTLTATTAGTTANITARTLTVTAAGVNKVYDGTAAATVALSDNHLAGDSVTDAYGSAAFADKNVGTGKAVNVSGLSISGADATNYTLTATTASATANITARTLTVTAAGVNKVYDGTATATVALSDNHVAGDAFTTSYTASFPDKNVGTGRAVSVSGITISGGDAANYILTSTTASTTANITARSLTVTAAGVNKVYDGTVAATVTLSDTHLAGDSVTDAYGSAAFADKNVGTAKAVSVSGLSISGADAANYTLTSTTASTTANITARALTVTAAGVSKVYDGTATATVNLSDNRVVGDSITDAYGSAAFADKSAGTGRAVSVSGLSLSGADAANYTLTATTATVTANITPRGLTVTAVGVNRVYDGTTAASVTLSDDRLAGDTLTDAYTSAAFADKNVGTAKAVSVSGLVISGADAANYTLTATTAGTTADITARALTVSAAGVNKVYDGTTIAAVTLSDNRVAGDSVADSYGNASFADKNVGTAKGVSVSGLSISGADAANYTLTATTAGTTANITPRGLTVTATGVNKVYDGTSAAGVTLSDNHLAGDAVTDAYAAASFADKNAGTGKAVTVNGLAISGADAANYTLVSTTASTTANITARALTVTAAGVSKVYDGTATATVTLSDNRLAGDAFTDAYAAASFADKNVGAGKAVSVGGMTISGPDAVNYTLTATTAGTAANITPRGLTVSATAANKVYDGTNAATVTLSDNRVAGDALTDAYTSASFTDKNAGTGKAVSVSGLSISGADAANYTLTTTTAGTTADITPRGLTVTAAGVNKVYDGMTTATVTLSDNRVAGDSFTDAYAAAFADKNVGTAKAVSVSGLSITGADAANYTLTTTTAATTADITARALAGGITVSDKVYDGTAAATITGHSLMGVLGSDNVSYVGGTATFADKHAGPGKTVTATGLGLSGADAGNYAVNGTATTTAAITPHALAVTVGNAGRAYGQANPTFTVTYNGFVGGDSAASLGGTLTYSTAATASSPVGSYPVSAAGLTSGDYAISYTSGALTITKATPNITWAKPADIAYGTALGGAQLNASADVAGSFSYTPATGTILGPGSNQTLSATFVPQDGFDYNGAGAAVTINVTHGVSVTGLILLTSQAALGQPVTLVARVSPAAHGTIDPTGTVTFQHGGTVIGVATVRGRQAILTTTALWAGQNAITASYGGDVAFGPSQSAAQVVRVGSPTEQFIGQAYQDLFGWPANSGALAYWSSLMSQGWTRGQVIATLQNSTAYRQKVTQDAFQRILRHSADALSLDADVNYLAQGGTLQGLEAALYGSQEYLVTQGGGTNLGFLSALYQDALGRAIDPGAVAFWQQQLGTGVTRTSVAQQLLSSQAADAALAELLYETYLQRPADKGGLAQCTQELLQGTRADALVTGLVASDEFFANA